jgi:ferritin
MLPKADLNKVISTLEAMKNYELKLADFYSSCAKIWKEGETFWRALADAEVKHAENIEQMKHIIEQRPERFEIGRPFNHVAINTALSYIEEYSKKIAEKTCPLDKVLFAFRDIEKSILESYYVEIVKTKDIEYQTLMKDILSQTLEHKKVIEKKIEEIKG